jgi:hypothetical protein
MNQKRLYQNTKNTIHLLKEKKDLLIHSKLGLLSQDSGLGDSVMDKEFRFGLMVPDMKVKTATILMPNIG